MILFVKVVVCHCIFLRPYVGNMCLSFYRVDLLRGFLKYLDIRLCKIRNNLSLY